MLDPIYWEECYYDLDTRWINLASQARQVRERRRLARDLRLGHVLGAHGTDMRIRHVTRLVSLAGPLGSTPGGTLRRATVQDGSCRMRAPGSLGR